MMRARIGNVGSRLGAGYRLRFKIAKRQREVAVANVHAIGGLLILHEIDPHAERRSNHLAPGTSSCMKVF